MKKLLGSTLALAMFVPAGASAELLKNLKVSGSLDVEAVSARNVADFVTRAAGTATSAAMAAGANNDRLGHAYTRTLVSADWDLLDDVHARITLAKGDHGGTPRPYGSGADNVNTVQTNTLVQEANVKIDKLAGMFDTTVGRQFYGEAGDLIVYYGPRDNYGMVVSAIDAFKFDWKGEHMMATGIAGRTSDAGGLAAAGNATAATDLRGIVVSCNQHENVKPTVYVYNQVKHATASLGSGSTPGFTTGKNDNLWVAGLKAKLTMAGAWVHAELAKNFGESRTTFASDANYKGYAVLLKGGYKADVSNIGMIHPWLEWGMGTGDSNFDYKGDNTFRSIATDYRPGGIYGHFDNGAAQVLGNGIAAFNGSSAGLSNRVITSVGVKVTPASMNKMTTGVQFSRYAFHRVAPAANGMKTSRNIGSEIDVTMNWKHSENVSVDVAVGSFLPGAYIADVKGANAALNPAQMASANFHVKF